MTDLSPDERHAFETELSLRARVRELEFQLAAATRRAEEAEAGAAAMRLAIEAARDSIEEFRLADCGLPETLGGIGTRDELIKRALDGTAGRALLDELEHARPVVAAAIEWGAALTAFREEQSKIGYAADSRRYMVAKALLLSVLGTLPAALRERLAKG